MIEKMIPVESTNIAKIGYKADEKGKGVLRIEFQSGTEYDYLGVPVEVWNDFQAAESKGRYFHAEIKNGYHYEKVV